MIHRIAVQNVKCEGCASTIRNKLHARFGEVEVDLSVEPRIVSVDIDADALDALKAELTALGYPPVDAEMGFVETQTAKAKSFVSCAIGKWNA